MFSRRLLASVVATGLLPVAAVVSTAAAGPAAPGDPATAHAGAQHGPRYRATIRRTAHGIPHITADDFGSLGFGSGYAAAETSPCILADTLLTARGERSRWFGPDARYNDQVSLEASNLQVDALVTDLHERRVVERLLADPVAGPGRQARAMVRGYAAGVNRYLDQAGPRGVTDPGCVGAGYLDTQARAIDVWYGVYLANLLASTGVFVQEIVDADPPSVDDPGLPGLPLGPSAKAPSREAPAGGASSGEAPSGEAPAWPQAPDAAAVDRDALLAGLGRDPQAPFGSNATAVGGAASTTGKGMLLGNPHFPWNGRYRFSQQQLTIPGRYDVAGASLIGSPVVNIGWNKDVAWSHTVSTAYRFTPYEYHSLGPTTYLTASGPKTLEHRTVEVTVRHDDGSLATVHEDLYRTDEGYVLDAPDQLMGWSPLSVWAIRDANAEHLRTIDTFLEMGKGGDVRDLLRRQDAGGGMPWVNTTAADRRGHVLYADHSVVPNVPDDLAARCMTPVGRVLDLVAGLPGLDGTFADSACAWGTDADAERPGIFGPHHLPQEVRRDWVMNANDSYWLPNPEQPLEGYAAIIGCERCERTMRTRMVSHYVLDRLASGREESPASLRGHEYENRVMTGEVMREGGALDAVCAETGETAACRALHDWDGHSDKDSRGYAIVEEFIDRLPDSGVWRTPFDPEDPLDTPRGLATGNRAVVRAMADAIAALRARGVAFDAPWGALQVSADRGAPAVPLGGGTGDAAGNANALASRWAADNAGRYRPVTYGSSHIQAIAFRPHGRLTARTILTYGQSEDPRSPWSSDQTRMFSAERWVHFAFTPQQVRRRAISTRVVRGD